MVRHSQAVWNGDFKSGAGHVKSGSGALDTKYVVSARFGEDPGTNPEELIAAAHSSCYAMALSLFLQNAGFTASSLDVTSHVTFEQVDGGWTLTRSDLTLKADVPGCDSATLSDIAEQAKAMCPISRVLNLEISLKIA